VPILVNGAKPPGAAELPAQLVSYNFHNIQFTGVDATSPQLHAKLDSIIKRIREKIDKNRCDEWLARAKDIALTASVSIAVMMPCLYLGFRFWSAMQAYALVGLSLTMLLVLFLLPAIVFRKSLQLIYAIRKEEPGFSIFSAYAELMSCC